MGMPMGGMGGRPVKRYMTDIDLPMAGNMPMPMGGGDMEMMAPPPGADGAIRNIFDNAFRAPRPGEFAPFAPLPNAPQPPVPDHLLPEAPRAPGPGGGIRQMQKRRGGPAPMQPPMQLPPPSMMTPGQQQQQDAMRRMMDQQLEMYRPKFKYDMIGPGHQYGEDMSPPAELGDEFSVLAPDSPVQPSGGNMTPEQRIRKLLQNREGRVR